MLFFFFWMARWLKKYEKWFYLEFQMFFASLIAGKKRGLLRTKLSFII